MVPAGSFLVTIRGFYVSMTSMHIQHAWSPGTPEASMSYDSKRCHHQASSKSPPSARSDIHRQNGAEGNPTQLS